MLEFLDNWIIWWLQNWKSLLFVHAQKQSFLSNFSKPLPLNCTKMLGSLDNFFLKRIIFYFSRFWSQLISEFQDQNYSTYLEVRVKMSLKFCRCGVDLLWCFSWWTMSLLIMPMYSCILNSKIRARIYFDRSFIGRDWLDSPSSARCSSYMFLLLDYY